MDLAMDESGQTKKQAFRDAAASVPGLLRWFAEFLFAVD